jgi:RHS repeat-associated protein
VATSSLTVGSLTDTTSDSYNVLGERYCEVSPNANAASVVCPVFGASRVAGTSTWSYDADGNVTSTTDGDGNTTSHNYDADSNQTQVTDPLGNVTNTAYDADDRQSAVTQGYGTSSATTTSYTYDIAPGSCPSAPTGTTYCTQETNGLSNTTTSYYNALDQMIEQAPPNTTAQSASNYTYDGDGNVLTQNDASGTTTYGYDGDSRVTGITYSATASGYSQPHAVTYHYDADGHRVQMTDGTGSTTYGYDGLERLNSVDDGAGNTVTYKYDADGNPVCMSYPNSGSTTCLNASSGAGLVTYQYNAADQKTQMTDWLGSGNTTTFTYDNDGNLTKTTYPSGTTTSASNTYDAADALTDTSYKIGSTTTNLAALTRNADELIGSTTPPVGSATTYGYDALNRVTTGTTATYGYDAASELASTTPTGGSTTDFSYNADGQLCWTATSTGSCSSPPSGATTYSYSSVGERLSSTPSGGHPTTYGWDQDGNLVCDTAANASSYSCSSPNVSVTTTYSYNGDGLRTSSGVPTIGWSSPSDIDSTRILLSVSCASTMFCAAVDSTGHATIYNGTSWTSPTNIDSSRDLESVSCPTSSFCMAIDDSGYDVKWNGTSWSTPALFDSTTSPVAVSCSASSLCQAVDSSGYSWKYTGTWAARDHIDGSNQLKSVSCLSPSFCMAIDLAGNALKYTGSLTWTKYNSIDTSALITSVSCPSSSYCVAVDSYGRALTYGGSSWTSPSTIDGTRGIASVSCSSSTFCQAVDVSGYAVTYSGSSWTTADIDGSTAMESVSCQSSTFCSAVDDTGHALTYGQRTTTSQLTWNVSSSVPQLLEDGTNYYLYGPNVGSGPLEQIGISGSTPTYLVSDTTGVREQIGSAGALVGSMSYGSYGNRCATCSISTPFGFEGGYTDPTGLVYLVHRYYDPSTEQFLSVDPAVDETGTPYAFTSGDPVNGSDPSGDLLCEAGGTCGTAQYFASQALCEPQSNSAGSPLTPSVSKTFTAPPFMTGTGITVIVTSSVSIQAAMGDGKIAVNFDAGGDITVSNGNADVQFASFPAVDAAVGIHGGGPVSCDSDISCTFSESTTVGSAQVSSSITARLLPGESPPLGSPLALAGLANAGATESAGAGLEGAVEQVLVELALL